MVQSKFILRPILQMIEGMGWGQKWQKIVKILKIDFSENVILFHNVTLENANLKITCKILICCIMR